MKKELLSAIGAALVVGLILLLMLLPTDTPPPDTTGVQSTQNTTTQIPTTKPYVPPTTSIVVTPTGTTIVTSPPPVTTLPLEPGVVRLYTCDPQLQAAYVEIAAEYYAETGIVVIVMGPGEGSCEETLTALLAGENAPTLFCVHSQQMLEKLQPMLHNIGHTKLPQLLYSEAFAWKVDGKVLALAADVSGSGLIYNAEALAQAAFSDSDLQNFAAQKTAISYITANRSRLGFFAFAAPDYADTTLMQTLAGLFADSDTLRGFVDMYRVNTTAKPLTDSYFLNSTTVFYIGSTQDYEKVASLGSNKLRFLPAYAQGSDQVQCYSELFWAVNGETDRANILETERFLTWLVTAEDEAAPVDRLQLMAPFRDATYYGNKLEENLRQYISTGEVRLSLKRSGEVSDAQAFAAALKAYITDPTDENWSAVAEVFGQK